MQDLLAALKEINAIKKGKFILSSGKESNIYFDIKEAYGYSKTRDLILKYAQDHISKEATLIVGSGMGGIPLATLISNKLNLKLSLVRPKPKEYGTKKQIEGYQPTKHDKIVIVDDSFTTGKSLKETESALPYLAIQYFVVVKRSTEPFENLVFLMQTDV